MTTSLCPVLGQTHGQTYNGLCPGHFQTPYGKELKISFIGIRPYINYDPIGGSEFLIVKILAEKFKFTAKFIPERAADIVNKNGKFYGELHRVRCIFELLLPEMTPQLLIQVSTKQSELGIGQAIFAHYRYKVIDYLPPMYTYEFIMKSKRPDQIATFDTIIYPFDTSIWIFFSVSVIAQFFTLFAMQNVWSYMSGYTNPKDYIFEGERYEPICKIKIQRYFLSFSDIFLSTIFIPKRRPISWINRQGFTTRKNVILQWLFLGNVLILGYKSTLLSTLIPIRYESTIDTLLDMAESGLPLTIPRATTFQKLIATDPRPSMMRIYMKRKETQLVKNSTTQEKLDKMYF